MGRSTIVASSVGVHRSSIQGILMPVANDIQPRLVHSVAETISLLDISHATAYRLIGAGKLDARKLLGKTVVTRESIEGLIAELPRVGRKR
jgi:hypothetical protein